MLNPNCLLLLLAPFWILTRDLPKNFRVNGVANHLDLDNSKSRWVLKIKLASGVNLKIKTGTDADLDWFEDNHASRGRTEGYEETY